MMDLYLHNKNLITATFVKLPFYENVFLQSICEKRNPRKKLCKLMLFPGELRDCECIQPIDVCSPAARK
jgi:hypothetical protein